MKSSDVGCCFFPEAYLIIKHILPQTHTACLCRETAVTCTAEQILGNHCLFTAMIGASRMLQVYFQVPSLPVCVNPRRSNRPKQEIKRTQHPGKLKYNTVHGFLIVNKDCHKVLIHVVQNGTYTYLLK